MPKRLRGEIPIPLASRQTLGEKEVVDFETPTGRAAGVGIANGDETFLPARRRRGSLRSDGMRVVAVGRIEVRAVTEAAVDLVASLRMVARIDVRLAGVQQRL